MENQNQNTIVNQEEALKAYLEERKQKRRKFLFGGISFVLILLLGYFGWKNAGLFRAALIETIPAGEIPLVIPNYTASVGDEGLIALRTRNVPEFEEPVLINSVQFTLQYTPANALIFNENAIVFDDQTAFAAADLSNVNTSTPGQVTISFFASNAVPVSGEVILAKFRVQINPSVASGTTIDLTATNVDVIVPAAGQTIESSTDLTAIEAGSITVGTQNNLRLLYAESLDATHVLLHFSDLLTEVGVPTIYNIIPDLGVTAAERGDAQGHPQDTVLLTTVPQAPGTRYWVTIAEAGLTEITSNSQGSVDGDDPANPNDPDYSRAVFFGPGSSGASLSDFRLLSARATGARSVELTFSHPVAPASVTEAAFRITLPPTLDPFIITDASAAGSTVTLTTQDPLLQRNGYLVTALAGAQSVRRSSDGAALGINQAVFRGLSNGPRVQNIVFTPNPASTALDPLPPFLDITFDDPSTPGVDPITPGPAGAIGTIHTTGLTDSILVISEGGPNVTIDENQVRASGFVTDFMANYTFVVNPEVTANGFILDTAYNSKSFWGFEHDATLSTVGSAGFFRRNVIEVQPGNLNFAGLTRDEVRVFTYVSPVTLDPDPVDSSLVDSINVVSGRLRITTAADLSPGRHFMIGFYDGTNLLQTSEVTVPQDFGVVSAAATGPSEVTVSFSENVDQTTIVPAAFILNSGDPVAVTPVTQIAVAPNFRDVRLTLAFPMTPGTVYQLEVAEDVRSFSGGKPLVLNAAVFAGYQTQAIAGEIRIDQIRATSSTVFEVTFSGPLTPASVTPVNMSVVSGPGAALTVTGVIPVSGNTYRLTTAAQTADQNYFVIPMNVALTAGVRDSQNRFLNTQRVLNALGFSLPASTATAFTPSALVNDVENTVIVSGTNLQNITSVRVGTTSFNENQLERPASGLSLSFTLPAGVAAGTYNVVLTNSVGMQQTYANTLVVTEPEQPFRIVSESSLATPFRVPPDGTTQTTLRVLVEDPVDLANVTSVTVDLTAIGGAPNVTMTKATGVQPQNRQWYTTVTTIPATVATSATPTLLPVQARKGREVVNGTASVQVTRDVIASVAPTIDQAFFLPGSVAPDGTTNVKISAQVSDADGADTIQSVVANLGPVGVGFVPLTAVQGVGSAAETVSRFYESATFKIPTTTRLASYPITLTAQDSSGEVGTRQVTLVISSEQSGPTINLEQSYIAPRSSVPHDGMTPFSLHVQVGDPDTLADIVSVVASFGNLGLPPANLTRSQGIPESARTGYYSVENLKIPSTVSGGVRQILVTATDKAGSTANLTLQIDVTDVDTLGEPPQILVDRAYTTPRVAVADGSTPFTLHVFVRDEDNDLDSVFVNLGDVAQSGAEQPADFEEQGGGGSQPSNSAPRTSTGNCPAGSRTLLCLNPSVREGNEGQWFTLPDLTVRSGLPVLAQPYPVEVVAVDQAGKSSRQSIPILVGHATALTENIAPATLVSAVSTSSTTLEVVFSKELDTTSLALSGSQFSVMSSANISETLPVMASTVNAAGTLVTLTTETQVAGKEYVLSATGALRDTVGLGIATGAGSRASFLGFILSDKPPVVEFIAASSPTTIEVEFRDPLKPSSVRADRIEIKGSGPGGGQLRITGVRFIESSSTLEITTVNQTPNERYRVSLKDFESASGVRSPTTLNKLIKGFKASAAAEGALKSSADLNSDGRVDFIDFTMFSAVYGTVIGGASPAPATPAAAGGQPLPPIPDATVPVSVPAGR